MDARMIWGGVVLSVDRDRLIVTDADNHTIACRLNDVRTFLERHDTEVKNDRLKRWRPNPDGRSRNGG